MIATAFWMAVIVTLGFIILYKKLPKWLQRFLSRRYILLDFLLCWGVMTVMSFAITGIITAAFISLFVSAWLYHEKSKLPPKPPKQKRPKDQGRLKYWCAKGYAKLRR